MEANIGELLGATNLRGDSMWVDPLDSTHMRLLSAYNGLANPTLKATTDTWGTVSTGTTFLKESLATGVGFATGWQILSRSAVARADEFTARVALTKGTERGDNTFRALQMFKREIAVAIGSKRVIIKPNFVYYSTLLSCTHVGCVEGVLEFLKSIGKRDVALAESSAAGSTMAGYDLNNYWGLANKYPVKLMDLNQEGFANARIWSTGSLRETVRAAPIGSAKRI